MIEILSAILIPQDGTDLEALAAALTQLGFVSEVIVGGSITLTAPADHFADVFQLIDIPTQHELPALDPKMFPEKLASQIQALEFQGSPDFGPADF